MAHPGLLLPKEPISLQLPVLAPATTCEHRIKRENHGVKGEGEPIISPEFQNYLD